MQLDVSPADIEERVPLQRYSVGDYQTSDPEVGGVDEQLAIASTGSDVFVELAVAEVDEDEFESHYYLNPQEAMRVVWELDNEPATSFSKQFRDGRSEMVRRGLITAAGLVIGRQMRLVTEQARHPSDVGADVPELPLSPMIAGIDLGYRESKPGEPFPCCSVQSK